MKINCPNSKDHLCIKDGTFRRKSDSRTIQRFRCKNCGERFSKATFTLERYQKKRRINPSLEGLLASGVSIKRSAHLLKVNVKTVERRIPYLAAKARKRHKRFLKGLGKNKVVSLQFDDLVTKENSKLKPLTVSIAVDSDTRKVLSAHVSQIPAFGHLAKIARIKYGLRKCQHKVGLAKMFNEISPVIHPMASIRTDEHKRYPGFVQAHFPQASYHRFPSERGCVAGQGELKKVRFDPLFAINHTCAMMRANINRLVRRTWCTTKDPARLQDHIDIFVDYLNRDLIKPSTPI